MSSDDEAEELAQLRAQRAERTGVPDAVRSAFGTSQHFVPLELPCGVADKAPGVFREHFGSTIRNSKCQQQTTSKNLITGCHLQPLSQ